MKHNITFLSITGGSVFGWALGRLTLRTAYHGFLNPYAGILLILLALHHPRAAGGLLLRHGSTEAALGHQQASGSHGTHREGTVKRGVIPVDSPLVMDQRVAPAVQHYPFAGCCLWHTAHRPTEIITQAEQLLQTCCQMSRGLSWSLKSICLDEIKSLFAPSFNAGEGTEWSLNWFTAHRH